MRRKRTLNADYFKMDARTMRHVQALPGGFKHSERVNRQLNKLVK